MEFFLGGLGLLFPILPVGLIVLAIVAVAAGRREPDPGGERLYVFYLVAVTFVALFVVLFSLLAVTAALARLAFDGGSFDPYASSLGRTSAPVFQETVVEGGSSESSTGFEEIESFESVGPGFDLIVGPPGPHIRDAVQPAILAALAAVVLAFHGRRLRDVTRDPGFGASGSLRTFLAYLYTTCFASIVIALGAAAVALFALVRAAFPDGGGLPSHVERNRAWVDLISGGVLSLASAGVFSFHWRRAVALRGPSGAVEGGEEGT